MFTSFIVVTFNSQSQINDCLRCISSSDESDYEIIVVDNASTDGSADLVEEFWPTAKVIRNRVNLGFGGAVNVGCRRSSGDLIAIVNPDAEIRSNWLRVMTTVFTQDASLAVAGAKLLYPDCKTIQHAGGRISYPLALPSHDGYGDVDRGQYDRVQDVDYVTGAAIAIRRSVVEEIGYFDEGFYPAYFEEADICFRARQAGLGVRYVPEAVATHYESVTTGKESFSYYHFFHRNRVRFVLKHYSTIQLWRDFLPGELERLDRVGPDDELQALREAYVDNLAVLKGESSFIVHPAFATPLTKDGRRGELIEALRCKVENVLGERSGASRALHGRLAELESHARIAEPTLTSHAQVVGTLIGDFRRAWNWMSTKWYVRPIIQQQSAFNDVAVTSLRDLAGALQATGARITTREAVDAQQSRDLILLERRVDRIESKMTSEISNSE